MKQKEDLDAVMEAIEQKFDRICDLVDEMAVLHNKQVDELNKMIPGLGRYFERGDRCGTSQSQN